MCVTPHRFLWWVQVKTPNSNYPLVPPRQSTPLILPINYLTITLTRIPVAFNHSTAFPNLQQAVTTASHSLANSHTLSLTHLIIHSHFHSFTHSSTHSSTHSLILSLAHSHTYSLAHLLLHTLTHALLWALPTVTCSTTLLNAITHKLSQTKYSWPLTLEWLLVLWLWWRAVAGWALTVCNLLPTDSFAGIGVLRTGLKIS